eukprot:scaffold80831_cov19-Tisochrysis_lutea.AAC.1
MDSSLHRGTGSPGTWLLYTKLNHAGPPLPTAQMACSLCARAEIVRDTIVVHTDGQQLACKGSDIRDMIEQEASRGVPLKKEQ